MSTNERITEPTAKKLSTFRGELQYNVLGAWNGVTRELIRVTNETRVSSDTMVELLGRGAARATGPTTSVLDNARYQRCAAWSREPSG
ncbi:hypothetical protein GobsT_74340 [Gemmata obscuriglobus]|nr:hypothetical protein GobsT_74340 [Gemmata obscuriglobus]VTS11934.1 Transposase OS=mine drainage metagenome GN=B1A_16151 PE=4 SV=1 [Gemmata obscuriglobus UQM 2246]